MSWACSASVGAPSSLIGVALLTVPLMILGFGLNPKTAISTSLVVTLLVDVANGA